MSIVRLAAHDAGWNHKHALKQTTVLADVALTCSARIAPPSIRLAIELQPVFAVHKSSVGCCVYE